MRAYYSIISAASSVLSGYSYNENTRNFLLYQMFFVSSSKSLSKYHLSLSFSIPSISLFLNTIYLSLSQYHLSLSLSKYHLSLSFSIPSSISLFLCTFLDFFLSFSLSSSISLFLFCYRSLHKLVLILHYRLY